MQTLPMWVVTLLSLTGLANCNLSASSSHAAGLTLPEPGKNYQIVNVSSGLVIDLASQSVMPGVRLLQQAANGTQSQLWSPIVLSDVNLQLQNIHSSLCIDDTSLSQDSGNPMQEWTCRISGDDQQIAQVFTLNPLADGYLIQSGLSGLVLDEDAADAQAGGAVLQEPSQGGSTQIWRFELDASN